MGLSATVPKGHREVLDTPGVVLRPVRVDVTELGMPPGE
jgi:hypothetical protein